MSKNDHKRAKRSAEASQTPAPDAKRRRIDIRDKGSLRSENGVSVMKKAQRLPDEKKDTGETNTGGQSSSNAIPPRGPENGNALSKETKNKMKRKEKRQKRRDGGKKADSFQSESDQTWTFSQASGERYLDRDPIFTADGKHVILATPSALHVCSFETSLQLRSLSPPPGTIITDYKLARGHEKFIYASTTSGHISKWRWSTGEHISSWESSRRIEFLYAVKPANQPDGEELITCSSKSDSEMEIEILCLTRDDQRVSSRSSILRTSGNMLGLWVSDDCNSIIALSSSKMYLGSPRGKRSKSEKHASWSWRELPITRQIVSFDVRLRREDIPRRDTSELVDVAIGCQDGEILIYEDLLNSMSSGEKNTRKQSRDLNTRILHWHRNDVTSLKWSRDGNYLISGGHETVLVIWQLDTDHRQYLPHLSSSILNIVVSPSGSSYAVRLANNSVIVLATSSLGPTAIFSGLGLHCPSQDTEKYEGNLFPMTMDALDSRCILAAVPASQSAVNSSFLQTFDIASSQHVARQALARNSTTTLNRTPTGQEVSSPSINHLKTTSDGQWLISVEQWIPPSEDLTVLHTKDPEYRPQRSRAKEVNLRFWKRDEVTRTWNLNTRIDGPHNAASGMTGSILDVSVGNLGPEVATIGEDACIRIWRPRTRRRHGEAVTDVSHKPLQTWSCHTSTQLLDLSLSASNSRIATASLTYSEDDSAIAVYFREDTEPASSPLPVHFLDRQSCAIRHKTAHLVTGQVVRLGFLGRYLIALSDHLQVWDTVDSKLMFGMPVISSLNVPAFRLLSVQHTNQLFAVSFPLQRSKKSHFSTQLAIFKPDNSEPLFHQVVQMTITGLLANSSAGGFVLTDENAAVRILRPHGFSARTSSTAPSVEMSKGLDRLFGPKREAAIHDHLNDHEDDGERSRAEMGHHIAKALEGPISSESLSVRGLFETVAMAYSGKPVSVAS